MRNICLMVRWITFGKVCLGQCKKEICSAVDACSCKNCIWKLEVAFHWPHDRFALGWEYMSQDIDFNYNTFKLYMFFITFTIDFNNDES